MKKDDFILMALLANVVAWIYVGYQVYQINNTITTNPTLGIAASIGKVIGSL